MISEYLFEKLMDLAIESATNVLKESKSRLLITRDDIEIAIQQHLQQVSNWSATVSFNDLKRPKPTLDIFIDLDLFVIPKKMHVTPDERVRCTPLVNIFAECGYHFALLGEPGAGKTTSMKYLCQRLINDETFLSGRFSFPILVKLSEMSSAAKAAESLIDHLYNILGLNIEFPKTLSRGVKTATEHEVELVDTKLDVIRMRTLVNVLENLEVLLILDGFDELIDTKRSEIITVVSDLATRLNNCTMIITSRTGEFTYNIDNMIQYEVSSFNTEQISRFANKWLNNEQEANQFLRKIYDSPYADTAIRPLTLAHLCALYERVGDIPEKPKTVYKKVVNLLLEEWDQQRAIKRVSKYANFDIDRKFEFLSHLAYELTVSLQKIEFSEADLLNTYERIYFNYDLAKEEARQVANELETHTGLFVQTGYDSFGFAHKSFQEYLTAEHIVRLPSIPDGSILLKLPNELAVTVTISSKQSDYLIELIIYRFLPMRSVWPDDFLSAFFTRLSLEKPDLKPTYDLCVTLIMLYSKYVDQFIYTRKSDLSNKSALTSLDSILGSFENLMRRMLTQEVKNRIKSYYKIESEFATHTGQILRMITKSSIIAFGPSGVQLPSPLYIKQALLD